jgi:hypothetical protein
MMKKTLFLLAVFFLSLAGGRWVNHAAVGTAAFAERITDPSEIPAACRSTAAINEISVVDSGLTSETFLVRWSSGIACQTAVGVRVKATFRDGSTTPKVDFIDGSSTQALIKVNGSRSDNRAVRADVELIVNGNQTAAATKVVNF